MSRATIYRMFPGGKDVLFEALRVRELEEFFTVLRAQLEGADSLEDLLVRTVVVATRELRADEHLALMLASEPGETLGELTVEGVPRIIRMATAFLAPLADPYLDRAASRAAHRRCSPASTISYFLAPSDTVDLGDEASARPFLSPILQPSHASLHTGVATVTVTHRDNEEILGRAELDDIEAILAVTNTDVDEVIHTVKDNADALFTWDYSLARPQLRKLYEKGKTGQWNASTDLPWDTEVDIEKVVAGDQLAILAGLDPNHYDGTVAREVGRQGVARLRHREPHAGRCRSSSTASRAPCCARPRSPRPCRGTTPSCTPPRRSSTRPATSRCSPATSRRSSAAATRSTPTCGCCSTTSSTTAAGT